MKEALPEWLSFWLLSWSSKIGGKIGLQEVGKVVTLEVPAHNEHNSYAVAVFCRELGAGACQAEVVLLNYASWKERSVPISLKVGLMSLQLHFHWLAATDSKTQMSS